MIDQLRNFIRNAGFTKYVSPILTRLENWRLSRYGSLTQRRLSSEVAEIVSADGEVIQCGPPIHFSEMAMSRHELPTLVAFVNVFAPIIRGTVVWDVGGNAGFYAALLSKICGDKGRVISFEPVPPTFHGLCANLKAAGIENVSVMNLALSDQDGEMPISFDPNSDTTSSLEIRSDAGCVNVHVASGDALVASKTCPTPTMIKMDIEGHELKALKGMLGILSGPECRAVLCEIHFSILAAGGERRAGSKARSLLASAGFDHVSFISRSHLMATKGKF